MNYISRFSGSAACLSILAIALLISCRQPETTPSPASNSVAGNGKVQPQPVNPSPVVSSPDNPAPLSGSRQTPSAQDTPASNTNTGATEPPKPAPSANYPLTLIRWRGGVLIKGKKPVEKQRIDALKTISFQNNSDFLVIQDATAATFAIYPENFQEDTAKAISCKGEDCLPKVEATVVFSSIYRKVDKTFLRPDLVRSNQEFRTFEKKQGETPQPVQPQTGPSNPSQPAQPGKAPKSQSDKLKKSGPTQKKLDKDL